MPLEALLGLKNRPEWRMPKNHNLQKLPGPGFELRTLRLASLTLYHSATAPYGVCGKAFQ